MSTPEDYHTGPQQQAVMQFLDELRMHPLAAEKIADALRYPVKSDRQFNFPLWLVIPGGVSTLSRLYRYTATPSLRALGVSDNIHKVVFHRFEGEKRRIDIEPRPRPLISLRSEPMHMLMIDFDENEVLINGMAPEQVQEIDASFDSFKSGGADANNTTLFRMTKLLTAIRLADHADLQPPSSM